MVIIDTFARCAVGFDENAAKDMGLVIDAATRLRDCTDNGVVVIVHHTGKDGKTILGSSALE
jgi:RecA-family ATPase